MSISFSNAKNIEKNQLKNLYSNVDWIAYTQNIELLEQAVSNSLEVISAWDNGELIGLIRAVGDGLTILYIQDILVVDSFQNQGIGTQLIQKLLKKYEKVRQTVLLTEEAPDVRRFYEKNEFKSCDQGTLVAFAKIK